MNVFSAGKLAFKGASTAGLLPAFGWALLAVAVLCAGGAGWVYTVTAVLAGAWFLYESHALYSRAQREDISDKRAMKVFHGSISYLTLLFIALAVDPFIGSAIIG